MTTIDDADASGVSGPIKEPLDGVAVIQAAWTQRDLDTLVGITVDDVTVVSDVFTTSLKPYTDFHWANNTIWTIGDCETADNLLNGDYRVKCVLTVTDDFFAAGGITFTDGNIGFVLDDGYITSLTVGYYGPSEFEIFHGYSDGFLDWLQANHPDAFNKTVNPAIGQIFTEEAALIYVDFVDDWLATQD